MRSRDARLDPPGVSPASGPWAANVSRALREILEAFASERVAHDILANALTDGGFASPPETAEDLEDLIHGSLRTEVMAVLGDETAEAVTEGLQPVLALMRRVDSGSDTTPAPTPAAKPALATSRPDLVPIRAPSNPPVTSRPSSPPKRPSLRAGRLRPPTGSGTPRAVTPPAPSRTTASPLLPVARPVTGVGVTDLVVITADAALAEVIQLRFPDRNVVVVETIRALVKARVAVIDTRHALDALRETWAAGIAPQVAILWPAEMRDRSRFEALQPHVPRVVCAGDEAELADVALLVQVQLTSR